MELKTEACTKLFKNVYLITSLSGWRTALRLYLAEGTLDYSPSAVWGVCVPPTVYPAVITLVRSANGRHQTVVDVGVCTVVEYRDRLARDRTALSQCIDRLNLVIEA